MQAAAVAVIVALAAVYATWKLMPRALRARLASGVVGWARRRGRLTEDGATLLSRRLNAGGCGSCDSCGSCGPKDAAASEASAMRFLPQLSGDEREPDRSTAARSS
jgi:hypothetical protein